MPSGAADDRAVAVASEAIDAIVAHAREQAPAECCGLLLGASNAISGAHRTRNVADSPLSRFVIDPRDHIDGRREARRLGLDVAGFYHSHPQSPAEPSETDVREAGYPDHLYLIVSLAADPPDVELYRLEQGALVRVPIRP